MLQSHVIINTHERRVFGYRFLPLAVAGVLRQTHDQWVASIIYDPGTPEDVHHDAIRLGVEIAIENGSLDAERVASRFRRVVSDSPWIWDKRNCGLDQVADDEIAVQFDDDDYYGPEYLERLVRHYDETPGCPLINVQRVNCYDVARRRRGIDGQSGAALHSCRAAYAKSFRYGRWRGQPYGEDTAYNIAVAAAKIIESARLAPDSVGDQVVVMRYGAGHTWPWKGNHVLTIQDARGDWLRHKLGRPLADRYLGMVPQAEESAARGPASRCRGCGSLTRKWGFSVCTRAGSPHSAQHAASIGALIRSMHSCPDGKWTTDRAARIAGGDRLPQATLYGIRREACKRCEHYSIEADIANDGHCESLINRDGVRACIKGWNAALRTGVFPAGIGCIQSGDQVEAGRVLFAGFVAPGGKTDDVEIDMPLAGIAGRTAMRWTRADRVGAESGDWFVSGNRWHGTPDVVGVRRCDWIYESIGHWGSPERYRAVYGGPIGEVQCVANAQYAERPGNVYLPNYGYYEWQTSARPQNTGERLCVAVIANTGLYGLGVDKRQICLGIAAGGQPGEVDLVGRAFGRPVPGYWWDTPAAYARGTFAIVIENVHHSEFSAGYLTEKLYQAVMGGAIPCYLGAWDVERLVPEGCYVDLRPFVGRWGDVAPHLRGLDADGYRRRISEWMQSDVFKSRSFERCCVEIDRVLCRLIAKA